MRLRSEYADKRQVSVLVQVVETIPYKELVRNFESHVVELPRFGTQFCIRCAAYASLGFLGRISPVLADTAGLLMNSVVCIRNLTVPKIR